MSNDDSASASDNIAQSRDTMYKILKQMEESSSLIDGSNKTNKSEHPILGHLTVIEWYKLVLFQFKYLGNTKHKIHQLLTHQ